MSIQQMFLGGAQSGYNLLRSLRFRSSASAYLSRTPASAGNRETWTWSGWVKRGSLGGLQGLFGAGNGAAINTNTLQFSSDNLSLTVSDGTYALTSSAVFRDTSAWYHIVCVYNSSNAVSTDRIRLYVNGERLTAFSTTNYPTSGYDGFINNAAPHGLGARYRGGSYQSFFDGYLAEVNFIDGQALDPTSFGSFSPTTGVWQPARYTGTYGTNGFYLPFTDNSTAAALGTDFSGNGNTWTTNNISITAGVTYDSMTDVPTLTSETAANYAVLNPLSKYGPTILSEANLKISAAGSAIWYPAAASIEIPTSGKYFFEFTIGASDAGLMRHYIGIITDTFPISTATGIGNSTQGWGYFANEGNVYNNSSVIVTLTSATTNDVIGVAFDSDAGTLQFYKNGSAMGSALTGFTSSYYFACAVFGVATGFINFGQRPFAYTPPTGFKALNTFNLLGSSIVAGNEYFNAVTYTGNGTADRAIDIGFATDLFWVKQRSGANVHYLTDVVRGPLKGLSSNLTDAESTFDSVRSFTSTGVTVGTSATTNSSGQTYVGWNWKAGGTAVTNTDGTISAQVSANPTAGFSVVTWTATNAAATIGHGLGVAPRFILIKDRSIVSNWTAYHASVGNTAGLVLNLTNAASTNINFWNNTSPTSSVFSVGSYSNYSTDPHVAYVFAEIDGYSKFGSYTGNGSTDGAFVYLGFRPAFVLTKRINSTSNWTILDFAREGYNVDNDPLYPNLTNAESTTDLTDLLSNGFKLRSTDGGVNASGGVYIYAAFAENPFKNSLAR